MELAPLLYREVLKIHENEELTLADKIQAQYNLLLNVFFEATAKEKLHFTTIFARITFVCHKHHFSNQTQFFIHTFRKVAKRMATISIKENINLELEYQLGLKVLAETILILFKTSVPNELAIILPLDGFYRINPVKIIDNKAKIRAVLLEDISEKQQFLARTEADDSKEIFIQYNINERNANFNPTIKAIRSLFPFPLNVNLLEVEIDEKGIFRPRGIVLEPDYLIDVTAIAECVKNTGTEPLSHLLKRFLPMESTSAIMLGNIANFFLDALIVNPEASFDDIFRKVFKINPLQFCLMTDENIRKLMSDARGHFYNIKLMVMQGFEENKIIVKDCFLEPSFYSETYGIQGRLDLFYSNGNKQAAIIELKSGKTFKPNAYGINHNHFTQTLLYDLLIRSAFDGLEPMNYILYSLYDAKTLRYAPTIKAEQYEAIQVRNQLVAIEQALINLSKNNLDKKEEDNIFTKLQSHFFGISDGFLKRDVEHFEKIYSNLSDLEKAYFHAFTSFIAREQKLAKTGQEGVETANGLASLWLDDLNTKEEKYEIFGRLKIKENLSNDENPIIRFEKTSKTNPLANFRKGDIAVLYPFVKEGSNVLQNQIFRCTIIEITSEDISIRLRAQQSNSSIFEKFEFWNIEKDLIDKTFGELHRSLFSFFKSAEYKKKLLLGLQAPAPPMEQEINVPLDLTKEQQLIFKKIINAQDYFLLWGPPGTGKTSIMLRNLVAYLMKNSNESILLLAYTNKAVDEICEALEGILPNIRGLYFRIGSRYGTHPDFLEQLLDSKVENIKSRKDLLSIVQSHRIVVGTIASINGKSELFQLKNFDRVIIDEASQLIEPNLIGLLPLFKRFILIGDHKQLPAVVVQNEVESSVNDSILHEIGLKNLRHSLFERLYKRCQENNWDWAYSCLTYQGRMHDEIMQFPSHVFYEDKLRVLPSAIKAFQLEPLSLVSPPNASELENLLSQYRLLFLPTQVDEASKNYKTNQYEAEKTALIIRAFHRIYISNNLDFHANSLGVITPYRAQIAQIRQTLEEMNIPNDLITIDTVERYQGGARDIIILSLCTNKSSQMQALSSLSDEGVDRKLNVALTRARKHLIILGNQRVLSQSPIYDKLIQYCLGN